MSVTQHKGPAGHPWKEPGEATFEKGDLSMAEDRTREEYDRILAETGGTGTRKEWGNSQGSSK